jgi:CheY-like chemotaxis protein
MRVLLVDDDEYNLLIVRRLLPSPPFEVSTAINGRVAVAAAERQWPDLVFMDLDMPVMGGLEAVAKLREHERASQARRCTMVALSSHEDEPTQKLALAAGFDRYLVKPVTREAIHATLLELYTPGAAALQPPPPFAPAHNGQAQPADVVLVDADIEPVLADFMASRRLLIEALDQAMRQDDRAEVRRIAHQLAGSFALYGFGWASERSRWLEKNFREAAPAEVQALAGALREHLDTVEIRFTGDAG